MVFRQTLHGLFAGFFAPQSLEIVTIPDFRSHDVNNDRPEIDQNPAACALSGFRERSERELLTDLAFEKAGQRPELRFGVRGGDHEIVRNGRRVAHMDLHGIFRKFFIHALHAEIRQFTNASVARFPLAIGRQETNGDETKRVSAFVNMEVWRKNEHTESFDQLAKGALLTFEGYFKPEEWTDKDGVKHNRVIMVATKFYPVPEEEEAPAEQKKAEKKKGKQ